jgi:hypothetical protein
MTLKFSKKFIYSALAVGLFISVLSPLSVNAATFTSGTDENGDITIGEIQENLYVAGNDVKVRAPVRKDLVVAGSTVDISSPVERNIIAAANEISITSQIVGGSVRAAGNELNISGNFNEDLVLAGNKVVIKNAKIKGDLVVRSNDLTLENSYINGKFIGSYNKLSGNLNDQVEGQIQATQYDNKTSNALNIWFKFALEFSTLIGLAVITFYLYKNNKLDNLGLSFNTKFIKHFFAGLGLILFPILAIIIGAFLQIYPLVMVLWALIWICFALSNLFLPIYISSILKNSLNLKIKVLYLVPIVYLSLLILNLLPYVGPITGTLTFLLLLANFGYLVLGLFAAINTTVKS